MRIDQVRELNDEELGKELESQQRALMNLRFRQATMQLTDVTETRKTRKTIARIQTVVREREIVAQMRAKQGE
jgi:large subunit ribosomal protein L29